MENDKFLTDSVDNSYWERAQQWEKEHWLRSQKALARYGKNYIWRLLSLLRIVEKYRGDDRNQWWEKGFANYNFLPESVDNCLEVGCGPYTNMRLIRKACKPKNLYLSDPLIKTYVNFSMTFLNEMYRKGSCYIDDHPLEELPFKDELFDLVVMINVLDHAKDANKCMKNLIRVAKPGSFILIGQDLTNKEDLQRIPEGLKIGHPIMLDEEWFLPYLQNNIEKVYYKMIPRDQGWAPQWHYATLLFAGTKR